MCPPWQGGVCRVTPLFCSLFPAAFLARFMRVPVPKHFSGLATRCHQQTLLHQYSGGWRQRKPGKNALMETERLINKNHKQEEIKTQRKTHQGQTAGPVCPLQGFCCCTDHLISSDFGGVFFVKLVLILNAPNDSGSKQCPCSPASHCAGCCESTNQKAWPLPPMEGRKPIKGK